MKQRNTLFNFFNNEVKIFRKFNTTLKIIKAKNTCFFLFFSKNIEDRLNFHNSFFKYTTRVSKRLYLNFFYNFFVIQWCHIIFKGKSYRIKPFKSFNKFTFNFGYSHWTKLKFSKIWKFFRRRRQKYVVFTLRQTQFELFKFIFPYIRMMNRYTLRGLRLKKQPIKRRFGKISQHVSILH